MFASWTFMSMVCYLIFHYQTISFWFEKLYPGLSSSDRSTAKRSAKAGHVLVPHWSAGNCHESWVKASLQSFTDNDEGSVWWKILENDEKQHTRNINNHYTVWKKNCFICHKCNFSVLKNECLVSRPSQARWIRSITVSEVLQILALMLN